MNKKLENYMELCFVVAKNSPDPNTKIGSILTDSRGRIIGVGYNGFLRDSDNDFPTERGSGVGMSDSKYSYITHSEMNSLHNCCVVPHHIGGAIAYVNGKSCFHCVRELWQFGVHTIYQGDLLHAGVTPETTKIINKMVEKTGLKIIDVDCSEFSWRKNYK